MAEPVKRNAAWMPRQHGAWFMLLLPFTVGVMQRYDLEWVLLPLLGCWLSGYLAFNAASIWLKSPPSRRQAVVAPVWLFALTAGALGTIALLLAPGLWLWLPAFIPLLLPALWLAWRRKDRSLAGGALTVAASSLMVLVARFPDPEMMLPALGSPEVQATMTAAIMCFGYLFGTVFYVKTMIRQRGHRGWLLASIAWHVAVTVWACALAVTESQSWSWAVFFAATIARSLAMPLLAERRRISPLSIGLVEIGFTVGFLVAAATA